jgi:PHD finger-like domain-containing protein 5A
MLVCQLRLNALHFSKIKQAKAKSQPIHPDMSRHRADLVMCLKLPGISVGRLCEKCDGRCPVCDSFVRPTTTVRICDSCAFGNGANKCVICGGKGVSDAYYCYECTRLEKDRDGCPKILNVGSAKTDLWYNVQKKEGR